MRVNSSVCWGDRQRDSSPDHAENTDSTAKEPLVTLDVKDPDREAGARAFAIFNPSQAVTGREGSRPSALQLKGTWPRAARQRQVKEERPDALGKHVLGFDTQRLLTMT